MKEYNYKAQIIIHQGKEYTREVFRSDGECGFVYIGGRQVRVKLAGRKANKFKDPHINYWVGESK